MLAEARDLMRALGGARDAQSALDALKDIRAVENNPPISARSMTGIQLRLIDIRDAAERESFTPDMRGRLARHLHFAALEIDRWPLHTIEFSWVADSLAATFRRTRRLVPDDMTHAGPEHLHKLRRRVVEYRHQMEAIEPLWPQRGGTWDKDIQRLRSRLGSCQDLAMLARYTATRQPLAPWRSRLSPMIEARRAAHLKAADDIAQRIFAERPKIFRRRIAALSPKRSPMKAEKGHPAPGSG